MHKNNFVVICIVKLLQFSLCDDAYHSNPYSFAYTVRNPKETLDFGHSEHSDDDGTVSCSYHVQLPDGRIQRVSYSVHGESGYIATVSYEGEGKHPSYFKPPYRDGKILADKTDFLFNPLQHRIFPFEPENSPGFSNDQSVAAQSKFLQHEKENFSFHQLLKI